MLNEFSLFFLFFEMCSENNEHNKGPIGTVLTVTP